MICKCKLLSKATPYVLLVPCFVLLFFFKFLPIITSFYESFHAPAYLGHRFIGLSNYIDLFTDSVFWNSFKVTLLFNLIVNPFQIVISFILALLVNLKIKGIWFFRGIYFLPVAVSMTVTSVLWGLMFNPQGGLINAILNVFGIPAQPFLTSPKQALFSIIIMISWKGVGYWMIFLLAGLQNIPQEVNEASLIDGANPIQNFFYITIPLLKRVITFVVVADTVTNFLLFAPIYLLTKGGPAGSTNLLMYEAYNNAFVYANLNRAAAITTILLIIASIIAALEFRMFKPGFEEY
ncbi:MAG: sugar ABC transporter permease [Thermoanaerobacteraceae bacterium]|nr:sugar ABC transporter permease [Thermoanaerobacteraceae bacterium]